MAKPKGINNKAKYISHFSRLNAYAVKVQKVYDTLNDEIARMVLRSGYNGEAPFRFSDFPETKKAFEEVQSTFVSNIRSIVYTGTSEEWRESNLVQDLLVDKTLKFYGSKAHGEKHKVYYQTNSDALKAFQQRKDKGMSLSQKLWNQSKDYKTEMEYAISSAIEKGTSAVTLSKRLSKYLLDFPRLQKDYKDKYGKAVNAADCEYRSIRLARSEINMAYRTAERERWQQLDFILGFKVKLTQNGRHKPDICDQLAGDYPKDFEFLGWHPNCMCYTVPILQSEEEFWGEAEPNPITDTPQGFKDYIMANKERIEAAEERGTLPYWYKDNEKYVEAVKEQFAMSEDLMQKLADRGFELQGITPEAYNKSAMNGFDILGFDESFNGICESGGIEITRRSLLTSGDTAVLHYEGVGGKGGMTMTRTFYHEKIGGRKSIEVHHDTFILPEDLQGKGISKKVIRSLFEEYERMGVKRVSVDADLDAGGYVWAKFGFCCNRKSFVKSIAESAFDAKKITQDELDDILRYLSECRKDFVPMNYLASKKYGHRLLDGTSWPGYIDLDDQARMDYLHQYVGMKKK